MILDGYWISFALLMGPALAVTVVGTLVIRLIARAAERRVATRRIDRELALVNYREPYRASARPFVAWIAWAFLAGLVVALLAQRLALS